MNENGERWADFFHVKHLVIGGTLLPNEECYKRTWKSPDGVIVNQIDHLAFSRRWRSSLQDVRVLRGADNGLDRPHVEHTGWTCSEEGTGVEPTGKRKRGRPQHTWRRTRMAELERKHLARNEAKCTAQNRVRWRALVEDLCSITTEEE